MSDNTYIARGDAEIIHIKKSALARVDYKIRVKINGKYYVGELEMSE